MITESIGGVESGSSLTVTTSSGAGEMAASSWRRISEKYLVEDKAAPFR
jgi:hypothetical protein